MVQTATKGSAGDSQSAGKVVDHEHPGKLKVPAVGGNLHLYNVNCFGAISNGDSVNFTATYTLTPKQTITSP